MACKLQPLRFTAREGGHRLAQPHVVEAYIRERLQCSQYFKATFDVFEKNQRFAHRQVEHFTNTFFVDFDFTHFRAKAGAVAVRAAQIYVRQKLHFDVLETRTRAGGAAAIASIKAKGAGGVGALNRHR